MLKKLCLISLVCVCSFLTTCAFAFSTKAGNIYDNNGNLVSIDGVAWIGFQDSNFLGGLWSVPFYPFGSQNGVIQLMTTPWTVSSSNITSTSKGVAFKSIRLAIQPGIWHNVATAQSSPFAFQVTDIKNPQTGNGPFCDWTKGSDASGHCIQSLSAPNLLTAVINEFNKQNMYVMLDFHHRPGLGDGFRDGTIVASDYTLKMYHDDVANFAKTAPANVIGVDIFNEPHQLFWFQSNTSVTPAQPAWISVIAAAAAAVYDNNQNLLLFVEAPGGTVGNDPYDPVYSSTTAICMSSSTKVDNSSNIGLGTSSLCKNASFPLRANNIQSNWGENFRSLIDTSQSANGVAAFNATFFRTQLIQAIQANAFSATTAANIANWLLGSNNDGNGGHLVFAPHLYGSEVGGWQSDASDSVIRFKWNFGFLMDSGFPFVVGELGFHTQMPQTGGEDFFVNSVTPYLVSKNINHNLFFWTWNQADFPIGIRTDDSGFGLYAYKELDLHNLFGSNSTPQQTGTLCVTVPTPSGYTGTTFPTITATGSSGYTFNLKAFDTKTCLSNVVTGNYSLTGSTLSNSNGVTFVPQQSTYSATVTQNTESDVSLTYAQAPSGTLQVNVTGDTNCSISSSQQFTVNYTVGSSTQILTVTGTTPATTTLPVGSYTLAVSPTTLPGNSQCNVNYNSSVNITANQTTNEVVNYTYTAPASCTIGASCSTWGTPQDSWAGSTCNLYINMKTSMTNPTVFTMQAIGITSLTGAWNATGNITGGNVVLTLSNPAYVSNIGFNANGVIALPSTATVKTGGVTYTCTVTKQ